MTPLSPQMAAREGFRLLKREPKAFIAWVALWMATFSVAAWVVAVSRPAAAAHGGSRSSFGEVAARFGPFAWLLMAMFLIVWVVTAVAAFRAVLHPDQRRGFFLRLGIDELRLGFLTLVAFFAAVGVGGAPAYLVFVLVSPIMSAVPAATRLIVEIGVLVTVWLDVWLGVRLSLIAVETYAERRFHLMAYWPVTRGRFWYLLASYFLIFLIFLGLTVLFVPVIIVLTPTELTRAAGGDILRSIGLLAQAGMLAGLIAMFWTLSLTLFYACQAHAFRAIVGEGRDGVAPA
ncbi:MAG TPA: hypothetical protein VGF33_02005 [Caulobacteraceae bacterium]